MLQQTQVATVVDYFERWMRRFPTVEVLAAASEEDVLSLWQGLGYYSRGRNLLKAACAMVAHYGGEVPRARAELERLPGVGAYTAAAVMAFAFNQPAPVVDANIARVLTRLFDYQEPIDSSPGRVFLEKAAWCLQPPRSGVVHNSALMELGALVCKPKAPGCGDCPLQEDCAASEPGALPVKRARAKAEEVIEYRAFVMERGLVHLLLSEGPRWRGMWLLPEIREEGGTPDHVEIYPITRYRVQMLVFRSSRVVREGLEGFLPDELEALPIPSPHRRVLEAMMRRVDSTKCASHTGV